MQISGIVSLLSDCTELMAACKRYLYRGVAQICRLIPFYRGYEICFLMHTFDAGWARIKQWLKVNMNNTTSAVTSTTSVMVKMMLEKQV